MDDETVTLAYTEWTLVELDGEAVQSGPDEMQPTIVLDLEESRVSGSGGVNRLAGTFVLSETELRFGSLATTRMAGPESAMQREQRFLAALVAGHVVPAGRQSAHAAGRRRRRRAALG